MVEFIKERISAGWYVHALFDVSKITAYGDSGLMIHDPFIYGYDDLEKNMYFMDNYQYGKSAQGLACYADINASSISIMENYDSIDWLGELFISDQKKYLISGMDGLQTAINTNLICLFIHFFYQTIWKNVILAKDGEIRLF